MERYSQCRTLYERLIEEIVFVLRRILCKERIEIHNLQPRIKDFNSFYNKIVRYKVIDDPFERICDVAGIRVICLYRSDLERIGKIIFEEFNVIEADIKTKTCKTTEFGYMSDHYVVQLSEKCKGPRYDDIKQLKCEIQVRTILMDAWDSISHHLDYKQEIDIPSKLRRDFYALSGLFYVADTHFEMFRGSVGDLKAQLDETTKGNRFDLGQEMNLDTLRAYLVWKLPERERTEHTAYSELLSELKATGYSEFKKLDEALTRSLPIAERDEREYPPMEKKGKVTKPTLFTDVGLVRDCLEILDPAVYRFYAKKWDISPWPKREKLLKKYRDEMSAELKNE